MIRNFLKTFVSAKHVIYSLTGQDYRFSI